MVLIFIPELCYIVILFLAFQSFSFTILFKFKLSKVEKSFRLQVPILKQYHKNIIGKGGANIKKIREETSTQVSFEVFV